MIHQDLNYQLPRVQIQQIKEDKNEYTIIVPQIHVH